MGQKGGERRYTEARGRGKEIEGFKGWRGKERRRDRKEGEWV